VFVCSASSKIYNGTNNAATHVSELPTAWMASWQGRQSGSIEFATKKDRYWAFCGAVEAR